jgi:hypothetical protein
MNAFRAAVEAKDVDALRAALHPEVVFRSPAVFTPYEGIDAVMGLLGHVVEVFEDFEYTDELDTRDGSRRQGTGGGSTHALIFRARVGDKRVEGLDHLTLDDGGLVTELVVMVRPLSGLIALAQAMGVRIEAAS